MNEAGAEAGRGAEAGSPCGRLLVVRGERYFVDDDGGTGTPVLLLHGWPDDGSLFRLLRPDLRAAGCRSIAIDWPAHGRSSIPATVRRCSAPELTKDLLALLDALGIDRVHVVAHDYGATVAWEAVALHPQRFASFVAISVGPALEILRDVLTGGLWRYRWLLLHGLDAGVRSYLAHDARRFRDRFRSHADGERILERLRNGDRTFFTLWERANPSPVVVWRHVFGAMARRSVTVPTLGIYGRQDEWMTEGQLARAGRHVTAPWDYASIDGGHWLPLEKPAAVARLALAWFAAHREPARTR